MHRTRLSLYYLASYLLVGGVGFLAFPQLMLVLFLSNGSYPDVMVRLLGMFMLSLGLMVAQFIRLRAAEQYPGTLVVRTVILAVLVWLYVLYKDPMLLVLFAIVAIGYVLTGACFLLDRATAARAGKF
jgi:uncharacterized protein YjeT (DUF2065 family)